MRSENEGESRKILNKEVSGFIMNNERKIKKVVRKVTFAEAEDTDNEYWANATAEERLQELTELRMMFYGDADMKMKKVVSKRNRYEKAD